MGIVMTQEDKELLLKDLCARLPYGVIINKEVSRSHQIEELVDIGYGQRSDEVYINGYPLKKSRPYLRPMSSMTEEEKNDFCEKFECAEVNPYDFGYNEGGTLEDYISTIPFILVAWVLDWLNSHHFDYRGLIEKGLALEAPEDMYNN